MNSKPECQVISCLGGALTPSEVVPIILLATIATSCNYGFARGGTGSAAQTGEEYRQTLRKALQQNRDRIVRLPWKVGSGMMKGARRGVFFCAVVGERTYLRFVLADEEWRARTEDDAIVREMGTCLRLIECEPDTPTW